LPDSLFIFWPHSSILWILLGFARKCSSPEPKRPRERCSNPDSAIHQREYYNLSCYFTIWLSCIFF
jgi:hypothetical protein